jgi:hypothetical protein
MTIFAKKEDSELQTQRKVYKACKLLGLVFKYKWTVSHVKEQYSICIKTMHPDHPSYRPGSDQTIQELRQAKDYLVKYLENKDD